MRFIALPAGQVLAHESPPARAAWATHREVV
jgi:hypothetical protein